MSLKNMSNISNKFMFGISEGLKDLILDVVKEHACNLYHASLNANKLKIFIEKQGGATVGDCEKISRALILNFAAISEKYRDLSLEVSTPGIERELYLPEHFRKAVGERIRVKVTDGVIEGRLREASSEDFVIDEQTGESRCLKYNEVLSAQVKRTTEELFKRRKK